MPFEKRHFGDDTGIVAKTRADLDRIRLKADEVSKETSTAGDVRRRVAASWDKYVAKINARVNKERR